MKSSFSHLVILVMLVLVPTVIYAGSEGVYRTEISATFQRYDFEQEGRELDSQLSLQQYFSAVKTDNHPFAEAAFLEKIGSVGLSGARHDFREGFSRADGNDYRLFVNYSTPDFPLVIAANFNRSTDDYVYSAGDFMDTTNSTYDSYGLSIGKFLTYGLLAQLGSGYSSAKVTSTDIFVPPVPLLPSINASTSYFRYHTYYFQTKYVKELGNERAINIETALVRANYDVNDQRRHDTAVIVLGDYYFTRRLSAGVGFTSNNAASQYTDGKTYAANVRFFITPRLSVAANYDRFLNDHDGMPSDRSYGFTLASRF